MLVSNLKKIGRSNFAVNGRILNMYKKLKVDKNLLHSKMLFLIYNNTGRQKAVLYGHPIILR